MNLVKIDEILKKEPKISFWFSLLPITLIVGILGQITILSQYNAVAFFSWGQILNDTAIILPQFFILFLGILSAYIYYSAKTNKKEKWSSFIILCLFFIIIGSISFGFLKHSYFTSLICSFFSGYTWYIAVYLVGDNGKTQGKNDNYIVPMIMMILVLLVIYIFGWILNYFYSFLYKNIEIKINSQNHKINYINDKYIFYSSGSEIKIIPNDGKYDFITK